MRRKESHQVDDGGVSFGGIASIQHLISKALLLIKVKKHSLPLDVGARFVNLSDSHFTQPHPHLNWTI